LKYSKMRWENSGSDFRAQNGEIIAESQGYESKEGCQKGIASVKENASKAAIKDCTT
jgi:uncharacterized protein YegP (UPF0339 family)